MNGKLCTFDKRHIGQNHYGEYGVVFIEGYLKRAVTPSHWWPQDRREIKRYLVNKLIYVTVQR